MTQTTIVGNLTGDPELRFTPSGRAVANFTVAQTPRVYDRESGEYRDGDTLFLRGSVWGDAAEHLASSLHKGCRVVVVGRLKQRDYETRPTDGSEPQKRTVIELDVDEVGPSLRWATVTVQRATRNAAASGGEPAAVDPWAVPSTPAA